MIPIQRRAKARNNLKDQLDLLSWSPPIILHTTNRAARKIADRFGLSLAHANVIVRCAGLGVEGEVI